MEAARAGDRAALEALLRVARPQIRRIAERYCIAHAAEDAAQEALWTLYTKLPTLRTVAAFPLWLLRIVARICSGMMSPLWRRVELLEQAQIAETPDLDLRLDLAAAIESLPETSREVLLLFYHCDLSVAELARHLAISPGAARVRLHRARELLRVRLTGKPGRLADDG